MCFALFYFLLTVFRRRNFTLTKSFIRLNSSSEDALIEPGLCKLEVNRTHKKKLKGSSLLKNKLEFRSDFQS